MLTKWIAENPVITTWITLISLLGVVITIIALILQIKDKRKRAIYYTITSTVLVDNEVSQLEGIKILFYEQEVATVVVSNIKLWNGGNEILEEKDFYPEHKLKVTVPENEKILAVALIEETDDVCKVNIKISEQKENEALVSFYCLEPHQGAEINVYHTNIDANETELIGKIKGGKVVNKSIEVTIEDGEMCMSTGKYNVLFGGGFLFRSKRLLKILDRYTGISVTKRAKDKK